MSYVDGFFNKNKDVVQIVERVNGKRIISDMRPEYNFYYGDPGGKHRSIYGDKVTEMRCKSGKDFKKNVAFNKHNKLFESDVKPVNKTLAKHFLGATPPDLHNAFFDIEVDFDPQRGYSSPEDAFMPITSIGVYLQWMDVMVCLAVPPKRLTWEQAEEIAKKMPEVVLFRTEAEMIAAFLEVIEDADILSGWNSEGYDIPYTVNRTIRTLGKEATRKFCLLNQFPPMRTYESHGAERKTYDLIGRVHLDYMHLYKKYNYEERHTYRLDYIGEMEVGERKVAYEGSLDRLYNYDFEKFLLYNIQDVMLLDKLDKKLKFINLASLIAHENTVLLPVTMGAVATTEQAIINEAHRRGMVVPDRIRNRADHEKAAGAFVATPKRGFHRWIGSSDLTSLYPSVLRALNMSNETMVAQISLEYTDAEIASKMAGTWVIPETGKLAKKSKTVGDAWQGKFGSNEFEWVMSKDVNVPLKLEMVDRDATTTTVIETNGAEIYNLVFNSGQPWNISANGTIFKTDQEGVIPGLLKRWFEERIELQAKKKAATTDADIEFWDKRQLVKKINLNSLYGALLNNGCRFYDKRLGQSTTLTGRRITRHMGAETNRMFTGEYDHEGDTIIYGDTDSVYFSAVPVLEEGHELDTDSAVKLYDHISDEVSSTFPTYLKQDFNVALNIGTVMKAGREVVGKSGVFNSKKRYAILVMDNEGKRYGEAGKLKAMGIDLKRSDTPVFIQDFLEEILLDCLNSKTEASVIKKIVDYKKEFNELDSWAKGMPKAVNNLTAYTAKIQRRINLPHSSDLHKIHQTEKENNTVPGHVRASVNWNNYKKAMGDNYSMTIADGMKVVVCSLKQNPMGYDSIAYPTDELHLPDWFKELPFDDKNMEQKVLDKKISNVIGKMGFDLSKTNESDVIEEFFSFG